MTIFVVMPFGAPSYAAEATSSVSATISAGGAVGTATDTVVEPATTSSTIRPVPVSTTSNVGLFGNPAPVQQPTEDSDAVTSGAGGSNAGAGGTAGAPRFPSPSAVPLGIGNGSAVAVAGAPNQTYSIILPESTVFASGSEVVSLNQFQHNAGQTPSLNGRGSGVFAVGADVSSSPSGVGAPQTEQNENPSGAASAFSSGSPIVNIVVSYN